MVSSTSELLSVFSAVASSLLSFANVALDFFVFLGALSYFLSVWCLQHEANRCMAVLPIQLHSYTFIVGIHTECDTVAYVEVDVFVDMDISTYGISIKRSF